MIRITRETRGPSPVLLRVEGKIDAQGVQVLEQECLDCLITAGACFLDFSGVTFIDRHGLEALKQRVSGKRVRIIGCTGFIRGLLEGASQKEEKETSPRDQDVRKAPERALHRADGP